MQNAKESYWVVTMALPFVRKAAAPFLGGANMVQCQSDALFKVKMK